MNNYNEICCLSMGRTGTNYLCSLLDNVDNIVSMREIFSYDKCYIPEYIENKVKDKLNIISNEELVQYAHNYAADFMRLLRSIKEENKKDYMFYKIFLASWQINVGQLERVFFRNKSICFIFMTRNILNTFISLRKAQKLGKWNMCDTSDVKINFDANEFMKFYALYTSLYRVINNLSQKYNKKILIVPYEEFIKYDTDKERLLYISDKLNKEFGIKLNIPYEIKTSYFKQDRAKVEDSVSNYKFMKTFLEARDLDYLLF